MGAPPCLVLDEPSNGMDPATRRGMWDIVSQLKAAGRAVVLTTHALDEAEFLADRIQILVGSVPCVSAAPDDC